MLNKINIMGRFTKDPELRYTQSETAVTTFCLAVERDFTPKNGEEKQADFIECVAWRGAAEFVSKYFKKGSLAVVSGRLQNRDWVDKDGNKRRVNEVVVENIYFGESKKTDANTTSKAKPVDVSAAEFTDLDDGDDGLPF